MNTTDLKHVSTTRSSGRTGLRVLAWGFVIAALAVGFAQNFAEMWVRWFPSWKRTNLTLYGRIIGGESYYTHGPLVPLVSLLIVYLLIRHTKVPVKPRPGLGSLVLGVFLLGHLMACLARVNFASGFALMGVLVGMVIILWGIEALRRLWFPLAFLFFMVPLPEVSIGTLNYSLKMFAADWGVRIANLGLIVERRANHVFLEGDKDLVIANVCNGLRTLITVIAFGALYSFVCQLRGWWRVFLFAMSVPVAVVANSIRIVSLIVVAHVWDEKVATGWYHDISGAAIFVLAFLMMFGIERVVLSFLKWRGRDVTPRELFKDVRRGPEDERQFAVLAARANSPAGWGLVAVLMLTAAGAIWLNQTIPTVWTESMARNALPAKLRIGEDVWVGTDCELDEKTLSILETKDYLSRNFRSGFQPWVQFSVIFSMDNRKGTHPPEVCYGQSVIHKEDVPVEDVEGRGTVLCRGLVVGPQHGRRYVLYVYKCGDIYTISFWKQQWVILVNGLLHRNSSGALVSATTPILHDDVDSARERTKAFMRTCLPYLDKNLP